MTMIMIMIIIIITASGLRDSANQELFCWGQYIFSFFCLKCTIIRYMGFILKTPNSVTRKGREHIV